jgi:hypothetical protein
MRWPGLILRLILIQLLGCKTRVSFNWAVDFKNQRIKLQEGGLSVSITYINMGLAFPNHHFSNHFFPIN